MSYWKLKSTSMRKLIFAALIALSLPLFAQNQEKEVEAKITSVTVYIEDARVTREKQLTIDKGKTTLKFTGLSPYIDTKSLQLSADGKITVLSVRHQHNFMAQKQKSEELEKLSTQQDDILSKLNDLQTRQTIISDEITFLNTNRAIGGANNGISAENLEKSVTFYSNRISTLKIEDSANKKRIEDLNKELNTIQNQMKTLNEKTDLPTAEVLVEVSTDASTKADFKLSYLVKNAGWYPSYDIRVKNVAEPMEITYKANVHQNTNVEWNDVKLKFSSGNPSSSGVAPKLQKYYIGYSTTPPTYNKNRAEVSVTYNSNVNQVFGTVYDAETNETLIGVNVLVKGTNIGTVTDLDGRYSLTLPPNANTLVFSYISFNNEERYIDNQVINVGMRPSTQQLDAVVVSASKYEKNILSEVYSVDVISPTKGVSISGRSSSRSLQSSARTSLPVEAAKIEYQTNFEFEIKEPYTVPTDGKNMAIDVKDYMVDAHYQYYSIPKIEKEAYLTAYIKDWAQYNFMQGEANVFFEDTYIGKTLMDTRYLTDSLEISLGKDKNVMVNREVQKEFLDKQFLRNKKEETRAWLVAVRNNKKQEIAITIVDQVPITNSSEVSIDLDELSEGTLDKVTGELKWDLKLKPQEQTSKLLKYKVKYPGYWNTAIE